MKYEFYTNCVSCSDGQAIEQMVDDSTEITYRTFRKRCEFNSSDYGYSSRTLSLKSDYHVRYYKSKFLNVPCYYMVHSAIEYIFIHRDSFPCSWE